MTDPDVLAIIRRGIADPGSEMNLPMHGWAVGNAARALAAAIERQET